MVLAFRSSSSDELDDIHLLEGDCQNLGTTEPLCLGITGSMFGDHGTVGRCKVLGWC